MGVGRIAMNSSALATLSAQLLGAGSSGECLSLLREFKTPIRCAGCAGVTWGFGLVCVQAGIFVTTSLSTMKDVNTRRSLIQGTIIFYALVRINVVQIDLLKSARGGQEPPGTATEGTFWVVA